MDRIEKEVLWFDVGVNYNNIQISRRLLLCYMAVVVCLVVIPVCRSRSCACRPLLKYRLLFWQWRPVFRVNS